MLKLGLQEVSMSLTSKQKKILEKFLRGEDLDLIFKNFYFGNHRLSIKKRKVLSSFGSVYTHEERGISYYNDYVEIPVAGVSTEAVYHTGITFDKVLLPLFPKFQKQAILDAFSALLMSSLEKKREVDVARVFGFTKEDFVIPNGYEVHQYFDETEYDFKVKNYEVKFNTVLTLDVCFWVKTYPFLAKV